MWKSPSSRRCAPLPSRARCRRTSAPPFCARSRTASRARREEFARTICQEAGKPIRTARIEVDRAINTFQIAAEESTRIYGEYIPLDTLESTAGRWGLVRRFPLGPVFAITPFNFPLNLVAHKVAPAIAAGCPLILKPAPQTPVSSLLLAEIVARIGMAGRRFRGDAAVE